MNECCGEDEHRPGGYADWGGWMRQQGAVRWGKVAATLWGLWLVSVLFLYLFFAAAAAEPDYSSSPSPSSSSSSSSNVRPEWTPNADDVRAAQQWEGTVQEHRSENNKTLVVYVYFEKNQLYKDNLQFFLDVGVQERDDVDYVIVLQGPCTVHFPKLRNLLVLAKENECLDFGGWRYGLDWIGWRGRGYRYFVFLNSSVRGPYVPLYVPRAIHWTTLFTQLIRESGDGYGDNNGPIKLVGMTINCHLHRPHVQSMLWVTDHEALEYLIDKTEVVTCKKTMTQAINMGEIALSMKLLANGWNIASMAVATRGWDFRVQRGCNANQDPNWRGSYYGIEPGVHETIFVKANRNVRPREIKVYSHIALQQARQGQFDGVRFAR